MSRPGPVAARLRQELAARERSLAAAGFLVGAVEVIDEGTWGRLDAALEGQDRGGKVQIHLSSKGSLSVVPQGAAASLIAAALGLPARQPPSQQGARGATRSDAAPHPASGGNAAAGSARTSGSTASGQRAPSALPRAQEPGAPEPDASAPVIVDCSKFGRSLIGPTEWRGVQRAAGGGWVEVFHSARYERGHNNLGEFLAIVDACERIGAGSLRCSGIRSDSRTAISWFSKRKVKSTIDIGSACDPAFAAAVRKAEQWLASPGRASCGVQVTLWDTSREGENPADFGRK